MTTKDHAQIHHSPSPLNDLSDEKALFREIERLAAKEPTIPNAVGSLSRLPAPASAGQMILLRHLERIIAR